MASSGGVKLGARISHIVSQTIIATNAKLLHVKHRLAMLVFSDISDIISEEVHTAIGPVLKQLHADNDPGNMSHGLTKFMSTEHGQLQALAGSFASASGLLSSVAQIVNNELSPSVRGVLFTNPHLLPDPGTIAQLASKGIDTEGDAESNIAEQGINQGWAKAMVEGNKVYPDYTTALDLFRKGAIDYATYELWCERNGIPKDVAAKLFELVSVPLSPADAALATLRGNLDQATALRTAQAWGVSEPDFNVIVGNTGEPPATEQLLEAHRRGKIDTARLVKGILQSRIRNEWVDVIESLSTVPMSTADAVNAVIQNHLTQAQGEAISFQNGLEPGNFNTLVETAGAPLSRTEMEELYNRGEVTEAQVNQALNESRLKPKYNALAFALHTRLLQPNELADMVVWGAISHSDAVAETLKLGYDKTGAERLISSAINRKLETQRMGVVRAVETLYEDNAISSVDASSAISKLGFESAEIGFMLQAAELKRKTKLVNVGLTAIRSKFIGHHVDKGAASGLIDKMGIPHLQRDALLQTWQIERDANVAELTTAQILKALKLGLIDDNDTLTRLLNKGYSEVDAMLLIGGA
jgi:hypothetical protein